MNITIVHGQNHRGSSYHIGRMLLDALARDGSQQQVTEFFLPKDLNHFCMGCYRCIEQDDACPFYAEKRIITDALERADLLIFTTPNYCMGPTASMKALIDLTFTYWMSHRPRACMFRKRAVVIATTAGSGARQAVKGVRKALFYWGVPDCKGYAARVAAMNWQGVAEKTKQKLQRDISRIARTLTRTDPPRVGVKTRLVFYMMGRMQKAGWSSSPVEKQYWQERGWLEHKRPWKNI